MNKAGKDLGLALLGLGMLGVGLFLFFKNLTITTERVALYGLFGDNFTSRGVGIFFIPMILGVILWVFYPKNIWPKVLFWVSIVSMILYVISLYRIDYNRQDSLTVIIQILLIFIGGALSFKKLVMEKSGKDD